MWPWFGVYKVKLSNDHFDWTDCSDQDETKTKIITGEWLIYLGSPLTLKFTIHAKFKVNLWYIHNLLIVIRIYVCRHLNELKVIKFDLRHDPLVSRSCSDHLYLICAFSQLELIKTIWVAWLGFVNMSHTILPMWWPWDQHAKVKHSNMSW